MFFRHKLCTHQSFAIHCNPYDYAKENQCKKYSCPLKKSKRKKLDIQELVTLEAKHLASASLTTVKELFLYSCYTGLAFVDAMALAESDFEWK